MKHTWSMRIKTQRTIAALHIRDTWKLKLEDFVGKPVSVIYNLIINSKYFTDSWRDYTAEKLGKLDMAEQDHKIIYSNHAKLPTWVPDYAILQQILIWHNAVQTTKTLERISTE